MIFFDTSAVVHSLVLQNVDYQQEATERIRLSIQDNSLLISTLIFSELIFVLGKLNLTSPDIERYLKLYQNDDCCKTISFQIVNDAFILASRLNMHKNINDAVHLKFAEKYCTKLVTFDSDFKKFIPHTNLEIEILTSQTS